MVGIYVGFQSLSASRQQREIDVSGGLLAEDGTVRIAAGDDHQPGTARWPFRTLERARAEITQLDADGKLPDGGVTVWVHGGFYQNDRPLVFKPEPIGVKGGVIDWRSFPGEKPRTSCESGKNAAAPP